MTVRQISRKIFDMPATLPVSYTTVESVKLTATELSSLSTVTSGDIAHFAGRTEAWMNSKLAMRYSLPFSQDIPVLQGIATDLTVYALLSKRIFTATKASEKLGRSQWPERFKEAKDMLEEVVNGAAALVTLSGDLLAARTDIDPIYVTTEDYHSTFHEGGQLDQVQDTDKVDDLLSDRELSLPDRYLS